MSLKNDILRDTTCRSRHFSTIATGYWVLTTLILLYFYIIYYYSEKIFTQAIYHSILYNSVLER